MKQPKKETTAHFTQSPSETRLVKELELVVKLVQQSAKEQNKNNTNAGLALVHFAHDLTLNGWHKLQNKHNLQNWLALSISQTEKTAVQSLLASQNELIYQRDHDALTDIYNRRFFDKKLEEELIRAFRTSAEVSIIMFDLDDFKVVNDTYGHVTGDVVLKRFAQILKENIRDYDIVARFGGEEFIILSPSSSALAAQNLGNRVIDAFRVEKFTANKKDFYVTASGGVASLTHMDKNTISPKHLISLADEALYDAKRKGKDMVCMAQTTKLNKSLDSLVNKDEKTFLFSNKSKE